MTAPVPAGPAESSTLATIRALFERKLIERATALSESRWPGSGQMIALANEWAGLSPADRRARLSAIGPQDLGRLRSLASLNPDLARVLDDLEARGVLPKAIYTAETREAAQEALVDAAINLGERSIGDFAQHVEDVRVRTVTSDTAIVLPPPIEPLPQVEMPVLDLGLPSTSEFLASEEQRRTEMAASAAALLERVRGRIEQAAERLTAPEATRPAVVPAPPVSVVEPEPPPVVTPPATTRAPASAVLAPESLRARLDSDRIVELDPETAPPTADELAALARALGVSLVQFELGPGRTRAAFGGLTRVGSRARVDVGPLPAALGRAHLVVVRGLTWSKMLERWREGFCDIPGTRASTRVDPACRVLVLPASG